MSERKDTRLHNEQLYYICSAFIQVGGTPLAGGSRSRDNFTKTSKKQRTLQRIQYTNFYKMALI